MPWIEVSRACERRAERGVRGRSRPPRAARTSRRSSRRRSGACPREGRARVLPAPHGFHVFRVEERLDARDIPFEEARPGLRIALAERRSAQAVEDAIAEARKTFRVIVLEDHLPFPYVGTNPKAAAAR